MIKQLATTVTTGAILLQALTPLAAADTTSLSGNGAFSNNTATVNANNTTTAVQNNTANISNTVSTTANTGNNSASDNTGGMSSVTTGNAASAIAILNKANVNEASLGMSMPTTTTTNGGLVVSGNGADSANSATTNNNNTQSLFQTNNATFTNNVLTNEQTGGNSASDNTSGNTSGGSVVVTGSAGSAVQIGNAANENIASLMGNSNMTSAATVLPTGFGFGISGNGFGSSNSLTQNQNNTTTAVQGNTATFSNDVTTNNQTGNNSALDNTGFSILPGVTTATGGLFGISTGSSFGQYTLDNMANFNEASLGNGDMTLSNNNAGGLVSGNGADSNNSLTDNMNNTMSLFQGGDNGNTANFSNRLTPSSNTGSNSVAGSTSGNTMLTAGQSFDQASLANEANMNVAGTGSTLTLPGGLGLNFSFNLGSLFGFGGM